MFPLRWKDRPNTLRLFQLWLALPRASQNADPN
jgi:quercetin 2,3-dioxygenase